MGLLFRKVDINGTKISEAKLTDLALRAVDSITLTGFTTTEELYSLLKVNCMGSERIMDEALKELALVYNQRAAKDSQLLYNTNIYPGLKESYITNVVLMDDKLKMIADVRSYIALHSISKDEAQELPITTNETDYIDASNIISSIAAAVPDNTKRIGIINSKKNKEA